MLGNVYDASAKVDKCQIKAGDTVYTIAVGKTFDGGKFTLLKITGETSTFKDSSGTFTMKQGDVRDR